MSGARKDTMPALNLPVRSRPLRPVCASVIIDPDVTHP